MATTSEYFLLIPSRFASTAGQAWLDVTVPGLNPTFASLAEFQVVASNHTVING